jgi:hypothetical protein
VVSPSQPVFGGDVVAIPKEESRVGRVRKGFGDRLKQLDRFESLSNGLLLHDHWNFVSWLQPWETARGDDDISPLAGGREPANLMRVIYEFVQVQSEFLEGHWNNNFDVDPVVISGFFLDVCRYREGSIHNLFPDLRNRRRRFRGLILEFSFRVNWVSALTINANQDQRHA